MKSLVQAIYLKNGRACSSPAFDAPVLEASPRQLSAHYRDRDVDGLLVFDLSDDDKEHEKNLEALRSICDVAEMPVIGAGNVRRLEDVKKILYAGADKAVLNFKKESGPAILAEVSKRFGAKRILLSFDEIDEISEEHLPDPSLAGGIVMFTKDPLTALATYRKYAILHPGISMLPLTVYGEHLGGNDALSLLEERPIDCIASPKISELELTRVKDLLYEKGLREDCLKAQIPWEELKPNAAGLIPVIVQDEKTDQVLMMAWQNEEAYQDTLKTGRMHYYSRSRGKLWLKGEESGHFQFVKALYADCDQDTLLAVVSQVGAACHTGNKSCFFQEIASLSGERKSPTHVLNRVYGIIRDRKEHPREGSYTNYLFDKGLDKILKKVGEESAEVIIAAKNEGENEVKYEIADLLYHLMVLMADKDLSWEDICDELARR